MFFGASQITSFFSNLHKAFNKDQSGHANQQNITKHWLLFAWAEERIEVCRHLKLEGANRDATLFKQGDRGDKFYMIICGSVGREIWMRDDEGFLLVASAGICSVL